MKLAISLSLATAMFFAIGHAGSTVHLNNKKTNYVRCDNVAEAWAKHVCSTWSGDYVSLISTGRLSRSIRSCLLIFSFLQHSKETTPAAFHTSTSTATRMTVRPMTNTPMQNRRTMESVKPRVFDPIKRWRQEEA